MLQGRRAFLLWSARLRACLPFLALATCLPMVGCTPLSAALGGLMGFGIVDSAAGASRETRRGSSHQSLASPRPGGQATEATRPNGWQARMASGQAEYRRFRFDACQADLTAVIDDPAASASVRATALIYRGAANSLMGNANSAKRDLQAAKCLGGQVDPKVFRPDLVAPYARCSPPGE